MEGMRTVLILLMLAGPTAAAADGKDPGCRAGIKLQDHGPNIVGYRWDRTADQDVEDYLNFVISQKIPAWHNGCPPPPGTPFFHKPNIYFAFTGEFAFYFGQRRYSSPVIGKRYLPRVFNRFWIGSDGDYLDLGFAHESNGQSIDTEAAFDQRVAEIVANGGKAQYARDYLSRGWDFLELTTKLRVLEGKLLGRNTLYVNLKYFLPTGPFQGEAEEYYPWETDDGKSRAEVDGISILFKSSGIRSGLLLGTKIALQYTTGYQQVFRNNTWRLEASRRFGDYPPFMLWAQTGYNTDLIDYYRQTRSFGVAIEMRNFLDDY